MNIDDIRPSGKPSKKRKPLKIDSETFRTPEEVAAEDSIQVPETLLNELNTGENNIDMTDNSKPKRNNSNDKWYSLHWPPRKKEWIVAIVVFLILVIGAYLIFGNQSVKQV